MKEKEIIIDEITSLVHIDNPLVDDIINRLDEFKEDETKFINSLRFFARNETVKGKIINSRLEFKIPNYNDKRENKRFFIRNVRFTNLNSKNNFELEIRIGTGRIFKMSNSLYPIVIKELSDTLFDKNLINDNSVFIPFKVISLSRLCETSFNLLIDWIGDPDIKLVYDLYVLDNKNQDELCDKFIVNQVCNNFYAKLHKTEENPKVLFETNAFHIIGPTNLIGFKIKNHLDYIPSKFRLGFGKNNEFGILNLKLSYILDDIYVFKLEKLVPLARFDLNLYVEFDDEIEIGDIEINTFCLSLNSLFHSNDVSCLELC